MISSSHDLSYQYTFKLLGWLLGPGHILENFLQVNDAYSVADSEDPELSSIKDLDESDTEDPTYEPLTQVEEAFVYNNNHEPNDSESDDSIENDDIDKEDEGDGSSEYWDTQTETSEDSESEDEQEIGDQTDFVQEKSIIEIDSKRKLDPEDNDETNAKKQRTKNDSYDEGIEGDSDSFEKINDEIKMSVTCYNSFTENTPPEDIFSETNETSTFCTHKQALFSI